MNEIFNLLPDIFKGFDLTKFLGSIAMYVIIIYVVFSLYFSYLVFKDSKQRLSNPLAVYVITACVFITNIIGFIVYKIFKPKDILQEKHINKLEKYFLEYETNGIGRCKVCSHVYFPEHNFCTNCGTVVRTKCSVCQNPIELDWHVCPFCGDKKSVSPDKKIKSNAN